MKNFTTCIWVLILFSASTSVFAQSPVKRVLPFSNYRTSGSLVFVSGQIGKNASIVDKNSLTDEVHTCIKNVSSVLNEAGLSLKNTVSVTVYLKNIDQFNEFNQVYLKYFKAPFPTRTCVIVKDLVQNANIEISVIASSILN
ncbi:RidA family protein [Pedobacter agri]|uniref:RidA family protein n=1 Tax=Pedobacter agri TaxID=454586 RepID=UPI002931D8FE|nr:RidA family protein [Pedobacter agri]